MSITRRIALLSWLVTIVTLVIFVVVIVPEQKRTYLENLESKARGISASLQEVTAGAAQSAEYDSVVDQCKQVLQGDRSIYFLVITKNDGYSLIHYIIGGSDSNPKAAAALDWHWTTDNLNEYWHPVRRSVRSGIDLVPIFNQRLFRYSRPFGYSGLEWGWIHVGLSLEAYDKSVRGVYWRTGLLAAICLLFSLTASVVYAKRLIQPLHDLNEVVSKITAGDFRARADIRSADEIQDLAQSFNTMTDALLHRDRILESVRIAAQQFLTSTDWRIVIDDVLGNIGRATAVSRVYVFENHADPNGTLLSNRRYEWTLAGIEPQISNRELTDFAWQGIGFEAVANQLRQGKIVSHLVRELDLPERALLESQGIQSLMLVPITIDGVWWGCLGLDECAQPRQWSIPDRDSLRTAAEMLGAAIARHRNQQALLEAKATLEQRVLERTQELQEQMLAKEKAHAELAEAQQRLIETSRLAGMAEIATGVLHNVGNVLNSVGVSATLVRDWVRRSKLANLKRAVDLLRAQEGQMERFLTTDEKGKLIPAYLIAVSDQLVAEHAKLLNEMLSVGKNVEHIKEIVAMQQSYAKVSGAYENLSAADLVDDAVRINRAAFDRHRIQVVRDLKEETPAVCVDRHKVLQILINLLRNAKYAMDAENVSEKQLFITVGPSGLGRVAITVRDTGVGIAPENLTKIFNHGFTTKKNGHGFGLHSGANAAKEMGGSLIAESEGIGRGATFILELPVSKPIRREKGPLLDSATRDVGAVEPDSGAVS